ncbi:MAG: carbohydrate ABC transporter permease, partial [Spirochaetia bacterium]
PFLNIIPFFQMMSAFGWINTWYPLIVPTMAAPFGIFLMSQFLKTEVPFQLMDSARIDGLSEFGIFLRIGAPLAKPAMSILGIVTFVGTWNNFLGALIFLPDINRTTIPVALARLFLSARTDYGAVMAGTALSLLPVLLLYVFFARRIIGDLQAGALKG